MRFVFLLILLAGAAVGFGYPWAITQLSGHALGTWRVQDMAGGFRLIETRLSQSDAPLRVALDVTGIIPAETAADRSLLTLTASSAGRTVLAASVDAAHAQKREDSPQTLQQVYRLEAGTISELTDGLYRFTVGPGDAEGVQLMSVDLVLFGGIGAYDPRAQPIGLSIMAVGFIGLAISLGRRRSKDAEAAGTTPPKQRWGRGSTPS